MTKVVVKSGICGFSTMIAAEKSSEKKIRISLESDCEMVSKMAGDVESLDMMAVFVKFLDNPVYRSASKNLKHVTCPVPGGILKAMEVEAGFALPKDVSITFIESRKISRSSEDE